MIYPRSYLSRMDLPLEERAELNRTMIEAVLGGAVPTFAEAKYLGGVIEASTVFDEHGLSLLERIYRQLDIYKFWDIYLKYWRDIDGIGLIMGPFGPVSPEQKRIDVAYLQSEYEQWKPLMEKTNHKHTVMQFLSKQVRDELKEAMAWSKQLQEGYFRRMFVERSIILFSRMVFIKAEEYYQEYDVRQEKTFFCGQETMVDGFAYTHILMRHFSPASKFGRPSLTYHHDDKIDVDHLPIIIFDFLSVYDQNFGAATFNGENIFFRFNDRDYAIWFKKMERNIQGGQKMPYLRVQTFYPADLANDQAFIKTLTKVQVSDNLFFYV